MAIIEYGKKVLTRPPYLLGRKESRRDALQHLSHDHVDRLDVPQAKQDGREAGQTLRIGRRRDAAMAQKSPQDMERRRARLVGRNISLELRHRPDVVHDEPHDDHVWSIVAMEGHVCLFFFFIVSKERVTRNYSNVKKKNTKLFPIILDLWTYGA
jgi:hypothetical protein